jgi:hypothetical protein
LEKEKELNSVKNKTNTRKEYGIIKIKFITIVAKRPEKIDTQIPLTVQLVKDMQAAQGGIFAVNRFSTSLYLFLALTPVGYGVLVDPVVWGLVDTIQKDTKIKQLLLCIDIF